MLKAPGAPGGFADVLETNDLEYAIYWAGKPLTDAYVREVREVRASTEDSVDGFKSFMHSKRQRRDEVTRVWAVKLLDSLRPEAQQKVVAVFDPVAAGGGRGMWANGDIREGVRRNNELIRSDTMLATIAEANLPVVQAIAMPQGGGAYARVKVDATAFAQRAAPFNLFVFSAWDDAAQGDAVGNWARTSWKKLEPHTRGFYVNEFNDDAHRMRETYGGNYDRLAALKGKFDPNNLFRMNANVPPKKG